MDIPDSGFWASSRTSQTPLPFFSPIASLLHADRSNCPAEMNARETTRRGGWTPLSSPGATWNPPHGARQASRQPVSGVQPVIDNHSAGDTSGKWNLQSAGRCNQPLATDLSEPDLSGYSALSVRHRTGPWCCVSFSLVVLWTTRQQRAGALYEIRTHLTGASPLYGHAGAPPHLVLQAFQARTQCNPQKDTKIRAVQL